MLLADLHGSLWSVFIAAAHVSREPFSSELHDPENYPVEVAIYSADLKAWPQPAFFYL